MNAQQIRSTKIQNVYFVVDRQSQEGVSWARKFWARDKPSFETAGVKMFISLSQTQNKLPLDVISRASKNAVLKKFKSSHVWVNSAQCLVQAWLKLGPSLAQPGLVKLSSSLSSSQAPTSHPPASRIIKAHTILTIFKSSSMSLSNFDVCPQSMNWAESSYLKALVGTFEIAVLSQMTPPRLRLIKICLAASVNPPFWLLWVKKNRSPSLVRLNWFPEKQRFSVH